MPVLILVALLPIVLVALMPVILIQRYRVGTARRLARPLVARVTLGAMVVSAGFFLVSAAVTGLWIPRAFLFSVAGLGAGLLLGTIGLWLTRWDATPRSLHYTPNRWLVLFVTFLVAARIAVRPLAIVAGCAVGTGPRTGTGRLWHP